MMRASFNASCPGEATGGFISPTGLDNVCRPYRTTFPLHVAYTGTQLAFAVVLLIVLALVMIPRRPPQPSISAWRAPTDFLLQTPGRELLQSVPDMKGTRQ